MKSLNHKGFTLIELLVVISIIGLLSSVVLASLNTARAKARDSKRIQEIKQLQLALQLYANDNNGAYPGNTTHYGSNASCFVVGGVLTSSNYAWDSSVVSENAPFIQTFKDKYMSSLPSDPSGSCITYTKFSGTGNVTGWQCYNNGVAYDPDGYDTSGVNTGQRYAYLITVNTEANPSSLHSHNSSVNARKCILGPTL